ncbi:oxidoreductase [Streptomyces litmocidini]|uniref:oxidoreductase n=1 Tax=Streptomyces litmocidini TaxID=67318 RepID=UPI0036FB4BA9
MTYPPGPPVPPYGYGYPPPPPPQPGVIPLAPLGFGTILSGAFSTLGRYWKQLLGVTAAVYGGALLAVGAALGIAYAAVGDHLSAVFDLPDGQEPRADDLRPLIVAFVCVWLVAMIAMVCASAVVAAACPAVVQEAVLGRPTTFRAVWRRSWSRMPAVLGTVVLTGLALLIPMALFAGALFGMTIGLLLAADDSTGTPVTGLLLVPLVAIVLALLIAPLALWIWVRFSLAPAAAVMEGQGAFASMRRSSSLVRGSWWRMFGCLLVAGLMASVVSGLIQQALSLLVSVPLSTGDFSGDDEGALIASFATLIGFLVIGQMVIQAVVSLFPPIVTGLLYVDQRIRKENLAPELARAAGLL